MYKTRRCGKATLGGVAFKTYKLFFIFHLIFLGRGKPRIPETMVTELVDTGVPLYEKNSADKTAPPTIILLVKTLEHKPQLLLVVSQVVDKLLKVQLPVQVFVPGLDDFLKRNEKMG